MAASRYWTTVPGDPNSVRNSLRIELAISGENGKNPLGAITKSALVCSSIAVAKVCFADSPKIAMRVTKARPIISADAVDAVRRGLRAAFWAANLPVILRLGAIKMRAAGRANRGLSMATPKKMTAADAPTKRAALVPWEPNSP